jgi:hypothetical protein
VKVKKKRRFIAVVHEPSAHPMKEKAEDENENEDEDEGCRLPPTPPRRITYYLLFRAEAAEARQV